MTIEYVFNYNIIERLFNRSHMRCIGLQRKGWSIIMSKNEFSCDCNIVHEESVKEINKIKLGEEKYIKLSDFFKVLGDNTRIKIVWALNEKELCVCDIANILNMTKSAVSHQLGTLRRANFVKYRKSGKTVYYSLADDHIKTMLESGIEHISE